MFLGKILLALRIYVIAVSPPPHPPSLLPGLFSPAPQPQPHPQPLQSPWSVFQPQIAIIVVVSSQ